MNERPILSYSLDALFESGIEDIVVCTGFQGSQIEVFCKTHYPQKKIQFVKNERYFETNNMYSLYLAKEHIQGDLILMNADVVFDPRIIREMIQENRSVVATDKDSFMEESMKVRVDNWGSIVEISKKIQEKDSYGCSIDVYFIVEKDTLKIKEEVVRIVEQDKKENEWTEVMLDSLFSSGKILASPLDIKKKKWFEIDNLSDLSNAEILFNEKISLLKNKKIFFFDGDGTLYLGGNPIKENKKFFDWVVSSKKNILFVTNNSSSTKEQYQKKLLEMNFSFSLENILTSLDHALDFLKKKGIQRLYFLSNQKVSSYILEKGFLFDDNAPEALLLTYDTEINFEKMKKFSFFLQKGIPFYATHCDIRCPSEKGYIPDVGTFISVFQKTTGVSPCRLFGKPNSDIFLETLKKYNLSPQDAVIVGDRLYTDIALANDSEMTSLLVLTGETTRGEYEHSSFRADIVAPTLNSLLPFLQ